MKNITAKEHFGYAVTIRRLFEGCSNEYGEPCFTDKETGEIRCFGGRLNPRPSYQREFVYSMADQIKVFETLHRAFPLGIMYWCDAGDGTYELIDGQQRTISILNILTDGVPLKIYDEEKFFSDLPESEQEQILDQELLEQVLYWKADSDGCNGKDIDKDIRHYLQVHRYDENAKELFNYYEEVLDWANYIFGTKYKKELPKVEWGILYNKYHTKTVSPREVQKRVDELMENPEITKKSAIFEYVFSGDEKILSPRTFDDATKRSKFEEQEHKCAYCGNEIPDLKSAHAEHIVPWSKGGKTEYGNLQLLCVKCNCKKSAEQEAVAKKEFSFAD